jgi:hypothetical protein
MQQRDGQVEMARELPDKEHECLVAAAPYLPAAGTYRGRSLSAGSFHMTRAGNQVGLLSIDVMPASAAGKWIAWQMDPLQKAGCQTQKNSSFAQSVIRWDLSQVWTESMGQDWSISIYSISPASAALR